MDSHTDSAQVRRLEVVQTGRRRRWSDDEKLRIVLESLQAPRQASSTARRHSISPSLLFAWRRAFGAERVEAGNPIPSFVPAVLAPEARQASRGAAVTGRMVIVLANGRRIIVDAQVEAGALARVLAVLERR